MCVCVSDKTSFYFFGVAGGGGRQRPVTAMVVDGGVSDRAVAVFMWDSVHQSVSKCNGSAGSFAWFDAVPGTQVLLKSKQSQRSTRFGNDGPNTRIV